MLLLELRTVQATAFKILVEALKELLTDTCIEFDSMGMKIVAMDNTRVVLVHLRLHADKFETYHCSQNLVIGVNMLNLHKLMKTINSNDVLSMFVDEADVNHLGIRVENTEKNTKTTYMLNLLDLDNHRIMIENVQFNSIITLPSTDFQKLCRDMYNLSDTIEIKNVNNCLIFTCKGDFCSQETVLPTDNITPVDTTTGGGGGDLEAGEDSGSGTGEDSVVPPEQVIVQGVFNLKFLVTFTKCTNLCNIVEVYLKNDYPIIIKYVVASLGEIKLCLAPQSTGNETSSSMHAPPHHAAGGGA
jgi:proliferating cell nuclear antigen